MLFHKERKIKMKKRIAALIIFVLLVLGSFPITADCADIVISLADLGENVEIHTELQQKYLDDSAEHIAPYAGGRSELSYPKPVTFIWNSNAEAGAVYQLSVSENADMSKPRTYSVSGTEYDVYNFRPETRYYWTVSTAGATSRGTAQAGVWSSPRAREPLTSRSARDTADAADTVRARAART